MINNSLHTAHTYSLKSHPASNLIKCFLRGNQAPESNLFYINFSQAINKFIGGFQLDLSLLFDGDCQIESGIYRFLRNNSSIFFLCLSCRTINSGRESYSYVRYTFYLSDKLIKTSLQWVLTISLIKIVSRPFRATQN